ncbi:MAG TPA: hypothetical protein VFK80_04850 [Limnochordia bacterium]|nr:hypothetical protein [Limnochordia bacterium]
MTEPALPVNPPVRDEAAPDPPGIICAESCVGVLYVGPQTSPPKPATLRLRVHNGRLKCAFYPGLGWVDYVRLDQLPQRVCVVHWNITRPAPGSPPRMFSECRIFTQLKDIQRTPEATVDVVPAHRCPPSDRTDVIRLGSCIGVRFRTATGQDVKNGKFLYAIKNGQVVCEIRPGTANLPDEIFYMHWNNELTQAELAARGCACNCSNTGRTALLPAMFPQIRRRTNLLEVRRTPINCERRPDGPCDCAPSALCAQPGG